MAKLIKTEFKEVIMKGEESHDSFEPIIHRFKMGVTHARDIADAIKDKNPDLNEEGITIVFREALHKVLENDGLLNRALKEYFKQMPKMTKK